MQVVERVRRSIGRSFQSVESFICLGGVRYTRGDEDHWPARMISHGNEDDRDAQYTDDRRRLQVPGEVKGEQ